MAKPIEMPFWMKTLVWPRSHVLDGGPDPPQKGALLKGFHPIRKHCNTDLCHNG